MLFGALPGYSQGDAVREYQIKAAFLFNFTQFVEWPDYSLPEATAPLVIGVLGEDPFGNYLHKIVSTEKVNDHPLIIQHYDNAEEIKACHILFINVSEPGKLKETIAALKGRSILTVSDDREFIEDGGMIRFITKNNKIKIRINDVSAKEAGLTISAKLLSVAEVVHQKIIN